MQQYLRLCINTNFTCVSTNAGKHQFLPPMVTFLREHLRNTILLYSSTLQRIQQGGWAHTDRLHPSHLNDCHLSIALVPTVLSALSYLTLSSSHSHSAQHNTSFVSDIAATSSLSGEMMLQGGAGSFYNGFQLFPSSDGIPGSLKSINTKGMSFGHG